MALAVQTLTPAHAGAWDDFVRLHPDGTFFHLSTWAIVLASAFRHTPHFVFVERDGAITGVLALAHLKSLFGNRLIAAPFCVYGGPLAVDAESTAALEAHAIALMHQTGAGSVEFRDRDPVADDPAWICRSDLYVTFRKPISADHDANMKAIPRKQRAMVRKGMQNGLIATTDRNVNALYGVYAESVRNLGTPVYSRRYFQILLDAFGDDTDIVTIHHDGNPVASVLNFRFRDEILPYYGGGNARARQLAANDFMYWSVMRTAAERGSRIFDFGRSKIGTGSYDFKCYWGFTPRKLHYRFHLRPGAAVPDVNPLNPKYRLFIAAWRRLPLPVANLIGPHIVRGIG